VRDGIELPPSFTATIDAELKVGALEESITVSGASPTVDTTSAQRTTVIPRDVLDALPRAVIVTDPTGRIVMWNQKAEALYGWAEAEARGRFIIEILAPPDALTSNEADFARVRTGSSVSGDRLVMRQRDRRDRAVRRDKRTFRSWSLEV